MTTPEECAWAAGFFDGEGWASKARYSRKRGGMTATVTIGVGQAERELLDRFRSIIGVGNVTGPSRGMYAWRAHGVDNVQEVAMLLWPFLGGKKQAQISVVIDDALMYRARQPRRMFSAGQLQLIRERLARGESQSAIARSFGCQKTRINAIARGRTYREAVI
jgi:hypothetical protein